MLVLKPIFIAFSDVFFGIIIIVGYILTALSSIMCSVPLSTPEMSKSSSGNLIADVIEKARPGIPVRLYTDNKVGLKVFILRDFFKKDKEANRQLIFYFSPVIPSAPLRRRSFLSLTHVLYRKGWCLEASSPIAPWRRRSFPSTDTGMQSSFSCPFQVRIFASLSFLFLIANVLLLKKNRSVIYLYSINVFPGAIAS
jgi:hypothetical protein